MTQHADVYAGDVDLVTADPPAMADYIFRIQAEANPEVLSRIANQFHATNVAPCRASLRTCAEGYVEVEMEMRRIRPALAENIARKLDQLIIVTGVQVERCPLDG